MSLLFLADRPACAGWNQEHLSTGTPPATGWQANSFPHSTTGLLYAYTDFGSGYASSGEQTTLRAYLPTKTDKIISGTPPAGGWPSGMTAQPYILMLFVKSDGSNGTGNPNQNQLSNDSDLFTSYCTTNSLSVEDGYLHYASGATTYADPILSIDTAGLVTLKYDTQTYASVYASGQTVTIAGTGTAYDGTQVIQDTPVVTSGISGSYSPKGCTQFHIVAQAATVGAAGTLSRTGDGTKTLANRFRFFIGGSPGYPPPRWVVNPIHTTRINYEAWRVADILAGNETSYVPQGMYIDEVTEHNLAPVQTALTAGGIVEYPSPTSTQIYDDVGAMYNTLYAGLPAGTPWGLELGTASYTSSNTITLLDTGSRSGQAEELLNIRVGNWLGSYGAWVQARIAAGDYMEVTIPNFPTDNISGYPGGLYAAESLVSPFDSLTNTGDLRMMASSWVVMLLMVDPTNAPGRLAYNCWNGGWSTPTKDTGGIDHKWLPLFETDLGAPTAAYSTLLSGVNDANGEPVLVRWRPFAHGAVIYRERSGFGTAIYDDTGAYTVTLPTSSAASGQWQRVKGDGSLDTPTATLALRVAEGCAIVPDTTTPAASWFASPTGASTNTGGIGSPWDLATALAGGPGGSSVQAGDTVYLRGGTYGSGTETYSLTVSTGTSTSPVTIRPYPGEHAVIDCATIDGTGAAGVNLASDPTTGSWLEITNSLTSPANLSGVEMTNFSDNVGLYHLVIHDMGDNGVSPQSETAKHTVYGCYLYNNGRGSPSPYAHGIYAHGTTTVGQTRELKNNIIFDQTGYGMHCFADTGNLDNLDVEHNICFGNGVGTGADFLVGGVTALSNLTCTNNVAASLNGGTPFRVGYEQPLEGNPSSVSGTVTNNYAVGEMLIQNWDGATLTFTGNTAVGSGQQALILQFNGAKSVAGFTWNTNTYATSNTAFGILEMDTNIGTGQVSASYNTLAEWQAGTGLDATGSTYTNANDLGTKTFLYPSTYNAKVGHLAIHNPSSAATVSVDISSVVTSGQTYAIYSVYDLFGTAVLSGTYTGGTVAVPMTTTGKTPPAIVGGAFAAPTNSLPTFGAFVVVQTN